MKKVEFYKLQDDGTQKVIAICKYEEGEVRCAGDQNLINSLITDGIVNRKSADGAKLFLTDGIKFLDQLKNNFDSGYLNASDIIEE